MRGREMVLLVLVAAMSAGVVRGEDDSRNVARHLAIAQAAKPSLVRVEYTLQFDKGQEPRGSGWTYRCPNCGRYHGVDESGYVQEERPVEAPGFVLSATEVITSDPLIHPRFVKGIAVRAGRQLVEAKIVAFFTSQNAVLLKLSAPLEQARPLAFEDLPGPYYALTHGQAEADWQINVQPLSTNVTVTELARRFIAVPSCCLIVDKDGRPAGMSMNEELPVDDSWKISPLKWPAVPEEDMAKALADLEGKCSASLLRVSLSFRSPKKQEGPHFHRYSRDDEDSTERNVLGLLADEKTVVVLCNLSAKQTARLERIAVHPAEGKAVQAAFKCSLSDYGCFLAGLKEPLNGPAVLSTRDLRELRGRLLLSAEVSIQGEKRVVYFNHSRIASFDIGWRRQVYPELSGHDDGLFLFDFSGELLAIPLAKREKFASDHHYGMDEPVLTASVYVTPVLGDLAANSDPANVPLSEAEENRLAWMGVELQAMDRELARANGVSHLTDDGRTGAIVSFVHPDSPADKAGIRHGFVLLRLHVKGRPKPLDVEMEDDDYDTDFPWERLGQIPDQFYDRLPIPWPSAENSFTRMLTDLGFGQEYAAEFFHDGQTVMKDFKVVQGPAHYDSAPRYKSESLSLTVRDMTYEVRRYFQKTPEEPGVIVSKVEPGGKASVAGIRPYEVITHVDDAPVKTAKDFENAISGKDELRLQVKRMTLGRVVRIKGASKVEPPASAPASSRDEDEEDDS